MSFCCSDITASCYYLQCYALCHHDREEIFILQVYDLRLQRIVNYRDTRLGLALNSTVNVALTYQHMSQRYIYNPKLPESVAQRQRCLANNS